jgi:hypothetical protein
VICQPLALNILSSLVAVLERGLYMLPTTGEAEGLGATDHPSTENHLGAGPPQSLRFQSQSIQRFPLPLVLVRQQPQPILLAAMGRIPCFPPSPLSEEVEAVEPQGLPEAPAAVVLGMPLAVAKRADRERQAKATLAAVAPMEALAQEPGAVLALLAGMR